LLRPGFVDVVLVGPEARVHERTREDERGEHDVSRVLDSLLKPVGLDEIVEHDGETDPADRRAGDGDADGERSPPEEVLR
jgi:hypothetical protein